MAQLPLPNLPPMSEVNTVDVFFRCDGKRVNQARFHDDLSLWLTFHIEINQVEMVNFRVDRNREIGGYNVSVYQDSQLVQLFSIDHKGQIINFERGKDQQNVNP